MLNYFFTRISIIILFFHSMQFANAACKTATDPEIQALIQAGAVFSTYIQTDFGRVKQGSACYLEAWPQNTAEVSKLVAIAYKHHIAIRTQGAAHSHNGNALPKNNELLIHTTKLNKVLFNHIGQIHAEAGVPMALLVELVANNSGYFVPISNSGEVAATVGGFISAGGLGEFSNRYGGFWEHVDSITTVINNGQILTIKKSDPTFNYMFGSMGQLGIITEAVLNLLREKNTPFIYPMHKQFVVNYESSDGNRWPKSQRIPSYWFTLFIPANRLTEAQVDLRKLQYTYPQAMQYQPMFLFKVAYVSRMPPLINDNKASFMGIGLWGSLKNEKELLELSDQFEELVLRKHYKQYIQTTPAASPTLYAQYFDKLTLRKLKSIKSQLDPEFLFNQASFFNEKINYQSSNTGI